LIGIKKELAWRQTGADDADLADLRGFFWDRCVLVDCCEKEPAWRQTGADLTD